MFIVKQILFIFYFVFNVIICNGIDYCSSEYCENTKQHTLCKFQSHEPARHCIDFEKTVTNDKVKKAILDKINSRRNKVASGEIRSFPSAANMMKMEWDNELEISAQRWANQCIQHGLSNVTDACRDLGQVTVGQNIATIFGESPGLSPATLVDVWFMELLNTNASVLFHFQPSVNTGYSHYDYFTQLIWATTSNVGCGGAKFKERLKDVGTRNRTIYRLVCNFAPGGNHHNETAYIEGLPCSQCPVGGICDSDYKSLCSKHIDIKRFAIKTILDEQTENKEVTVIDTSEEMGNPVTQSNYLTKSETPLQNVIINISNETTLTSSSGGITEEEIYTPFDYFSHLHEYSRQSLATTTVKADTCKNIIAVDKIIELLKKKLSIDPVLKELLLNNNTSTENPFSDSSVAAFVSRIYSKKILTTTTKILESDYVNSTLLVDLVEAVIFRSDDKMPNSDTIEQNTHSIVVNPVKIQAELAEVKLNQDFTGHFFFPEDNVEETGAETIDSYYDNTNLPVSDMILEIEDLRKSSATKDFLYEILESDSVSESTTTMHLLSPDDMKMYKEGYKVMKKFLKGLDHKNMSESKIHSIKKRNDRGHLLNMNQYLYTATSNNKYFNKRSVKKNVKSQKFKERFVTLYKSDKENLIIKYKYLVRRIAADLKKLKLNQKFHCARNCSVQCLSAIFLIILTLSIKLIHA